jgi:hypothetical protein
MSPRAYAQTALTRPPSATPGALRVFLTCTPCDIDHLSGTLRFVDLVRDAASAQVTVAASTVDAGHETRWTMTLTGVGSHKGQNRTLTFAVANSALQEQARAIVANFLALALAPYASTTEMGRHMDVTFTRPGSTEPADRRNPHDGWNHWVFRMSANLYQSGEQTTWNSSYGFTGSANRTTDNWKIRIAASRSLNESEFDIDEETITSRLNDWNANALIVRSLGSKWSMAITSSVNGSTFSNVAMVQRFAPGLEFDIFPYAESTQRSLTLQYTAGYGRYEYHAVTVFDRLEEEVLEHSANVSLGLRQPWGTTGASVAFVQQLTALDRTRLTASGSFSVQLSDSLSVNGNASYARIRDLFTLPRGAASDEEVLLRLRQLDTGYRYSYNIGFSYAFGALSNMTVNPRFGG